MPFSRLPKLRFTPPAGAVVEYDLSVLQVATVVQPFYEPLFTQKEMLDRSIKRTAYGWRVSVRLEFDVIDGSPDDTTLAAVWKRILDDDQVMEVSLDGTLYREATLSEWTREPIAGKNIGMHYGLTLVCTKLLTPDLVGPGETQTAPPVMTSW